MIQPRLRAAFVRRQRKQERIELSRNIFERGERMKDLGQMTHRSAQYVGEVDEPVVDLPLRVANERMDPPRRKADADQPKPAGEAQIERLAEVPFGKRRRTAVPIVVRPAHVHRRRQLENDGGVDPRHQPLQRPRLGRFEVPVQLPIVRDPAPKRAMRPQVPRRNELLGGRMSGPRLRSRCAERCAHENRSHAAWREMPSASPIRDQLTSRLRRMSI